MTTAMPLILALAVLVMARAQFWLRQGDLPQPLQSAFRFLGIAGAVTTALALLVMTTPARSQENHDAHHPVYQNWVNMKGYGCCNNQDCGELADKDEREGARGAVEVRIDGQWCPVLPHMYLMHGNAPNWSSSHVCVRRQDRAETPTSPCDRLLCYQPKPQT